MCGRMTLTSSDLGQVLGELQEALGSVGVRPILADDDAPSLFRPRYNVAPTQLHPVLRRLRDHANLGFASWGVLARGPGKPPAINARAETVLERPAFKDAFTTRRCVVPADGFFEWKAGPDGRQPLWFHRPDGKLILLAGLFEQDIATGNEPVRARFVVLTTSPNALMAPVHDRMPALLSPSEAAEWLAKPTVKVLHPAPDELLVATPVSTRVNSARHDDPGCLGPPRGVQMRLFE